MIYNPKLWDWNNEVNTSPEKTPAQAPGSTNPFKSKELSYSTRINSLAQTRIRSDSLLLSDQSMKEEFDPDPASGVFLGNGGNHMDAMNIAFADGHVEYHELGPGHRPSHKVDKSQPMYQLVYQLRMPPYFDPT
jgi:prepilin-type processing-associated H-X9-DG protein